MEEELMNDGDAEAEDFACTYNKLLLGRKERLEEMPHYESNES